MLSRLFNRKGRTEVLQAGATVPEGERIYAIGDIHGRADLLQRLHALIDADLTKHTNRIVRVVYLGDYVDRGPNSARVLEQLAAGSADFVEVTLLRGNHEEMLLRFLEEPAVGPNWRQLGGLETLHSYGIDVSKVLAEEGYEGLSRRLNDEIPPHHRALLDQLANSATIGGYFFCHAGVRPGIALEQQKPEDLIRIRAPFLDAKEDFGKIVVHGHSPTDRPDFRNNRINIDTGAYATGKLTCLVLEGTTRRILST
jgi:serine/threonine protein phosphatase 1